MYNYIHVIIHGRHVYVDKQKMSSFSLYSYTINKPHLKYKLAWTWTALGYFAVGLLAVGQFAVKENLIFFLRRSVQRRKFRSRAWTMMGEREVGSPYAVLS